MAEHHDTCQFSLGPAKAAFDPDLSTTAKALVFVLGTYVNGPGQGAWPSQKTLMKYMGVAERTLRRAQEELIERGYLRKEVRKRAGFKHSNLYTLLTPDIVLSIEPATSDLFEEPATGDRSEPATGDRIKPATGGRQKELKKEPIEGGDAPSLDDKGFTQKFNRFWRAWKIDGKAGQFDSKRAAYAQWQKLTPESQDLALDQVAAFQKQFLDAYGDDCNMVSGARYLHDKMFGNAAERRTESKPARPANWSPEFEDGEWGKVQKVLWEAHPAIYRAWLNDLRCLKARKGECHLGAPTQMAVSYLTNQYESMVRNAIIVAWGDEYKVKFVLDKRDEKDRPEEAAAS